MPAGHPWWAPEMPSGWVPPPRFGETTRLFPPAPTAEGGPTIRTLCRTKAAHSPRTQAPWGRPVSIPQCLETDRKQTGSPGVTAGFRFPRGHSRFPDECRCSRNAAEGLPFLLPRRCRDRRGFFSVAFILFYISMSTYYYYWFFGCAWSSLLHVGFT